MISSMPPFRGINEYQILRKINNLQYKFPEGFNDVAKDLVQRLLVVDADQRLGHGDIDEIKQHSFFDVSLMALDIWIYDYFQGIDWNEILDSKPPQLKPYIPASTGEPEFYSEINVAPVEPGLTNANIARLIGLPQHRPPTKILPQAIDQTTVDERKNVAELLRQTKLDAQRRDHPYHNFVEDSLIVKFGLIDKKKGLFARRRMFLLTDTARLFYVDPIHKVLRGEIAITSDTKSEAKNFRTFFVHTVINFLFKLSFNLLAHKDLLSI
jgi:3-phosphoinositide dependent protein kinase-1